MLLTRSAVLVRDVVCDIGSRLRNQTTILDHEVSSIRKHRHGGGKIDDESRKLLNSCQCQRVNTGHKLANHGEIFPCSIFLLWMILSLNLVLWQAHYLKNWKAAGHEGIISSQKGFTACTSNAWMFASRKFIWRMFEKLQVIYWTRSGKCSPLSDPTQGTTPVLFPLISTSTLVRDLRYLPTVIK